MLYFSRTVIVSAALASIGLSLRARADEVTVPLVESGDWFAMAHRPSITAAPDVCFAGTETSNGWFVLRQSSQDIEVRYEDESWSLPAGVTGALLIEVGPLKSSLSISGNTNDVVVAVISRDQLQSIVAAMDRAESMTVAAGSAAPQAVSLNGSNKATTALLTCAGITAPSEGGGTNPFRSPAPAPATPPTGDVAATRPGDPVAAAVSVVGRDWDCTAPRPPRWIWTDKDRLADWIGLENKAAIAHNCGPGFWVHQDPVSKP